MKYPTLTQIMVETSEYGKMIAKTGEKLDKKRDSKQIGLNKI